MKKTKKQIRELAERYITTKPEEAEKVVNMFYDLKGLHIEIRERQQLKQGRNIYGGYPYALIVNVFEIKADGWHFKGDGIITGDYAAHKGIENNAMDCIAEYYGIDRGLYLWDYNLLKKLKITTRYYELKHNGRYEEELFEWIKF